MKKIILLTAIITLTINVLYAQNKQPINNLTALAKVWGFLKYYHPDAANGKPDWDKELIRMIPLAESAPSQNAFNALITHWYHSLPKAKLSHNVTQIKNDTIVRIFDETAISHFGISKYLVNELIRLYLYHLPGPSKYITNKSENHVLDYIAHIEEPFTNPAFPDKAYRLLALFRYWNIINYFYPYKNINAPNWDSVLPEFIPQFMACNDANEYRKTFLRLTTSLKDSHSSLWDVKPQAQQEMSPRRNIPEGSKLTLPR